MPVGHTLDAIKSKLDKDPLAAGPDGLRLAIWRVWSVHSHLIPTPLPLAAVIGLWVREYGLAEADAAAILADLLAPTRLAQHRFASDLMTALASAAAEAIRRRRELAESLARRVDPGDAAPPEEVMATVRDVIGRTFGTPEGGW